MINARAIFLDLDGTLIGASGDISVPLLRTLESIQDPHLCVCTGRPSGGIASRIAASIGPHTLHAFHGGACVQDAAGEVLLAETMPAQEVAGLIAQARATGHTLELYTPHEILVDRHTPLSLAHARALGVDSREVDLLDSVDLGAVIKAQWIVDDDALVPTLCDALPDALFAAPATSDAVPGVHFITITRAGVDKGSAVSFIAQNLGVPLAACAGVGDTAGDLPMLEVVGQPFVMAPAPDFMRARFPVLPSVEDDGVLTLLG